MIPRLSFAIALLMLPTSYAHAICTSPKNVCYLVLNCLQNGAASDKATITTGIDDNDPNRGGNVIWTGLDRCLRDFDNRHFGDVSYGDWQGYSGGCSNGEYSTIGKAARQNGSKFCTLYPN